MVTPVPPKQSVWQKLFRAGTKPAKQNGKPVTGPAPVFRPLIARNTELPLPEGVLYEFPLDNDRARRMVLDVCFLQCTRQMPEGVVRVLRTVRFSGLRRSADPSRDRLEVLLKYDEDYELRVTANIRDGDHHDPVTVTIHMDDFGGGERSTSALK